MRNVPIEVALARLRDDRQALRLMGRKGGKVAQQRRRARKAALEQEFAERAFQANEHLAPVDDSPQSQIFLQID